MTISIINQKGGVGKTTTVLNLGVYLAKLGKKILLVDLDPQANLTSGLGYLHNEELQENDSVDKPTIYEVLIGKSTVTEAFVTTRFDNLALLPSSINLAGAEIELVSMMNRESLLKKALKQVKDHYDLIIIDCPPSLGQLTINALSASDKVWIPVQCEYYALEGLSKLADTIKLVRNNLNSSLEIGGVILTMADGRTKLSEQVAEEVRKYFKSKVFDTVIPRNVKLSEAPSHGLSILEYDPSSTGARSYESLASEINDKI